MTKAYLIKLYNTRGSVKTISRSLAVEIYYYKTLKYPSRSLAEIPRYPSNINTTKKKYLFIKHLIQALEEKRLHRLKIQKERRDELKRREEERRRSKLEKQRKRREAKKKEQSEFIDLVETVYGEIQDKREIEHKKRETEKVFSPTLQQDLISHQLYSFNQIVEPDDYKDADSFVILFNSKIVHPQEKFPLGQNTTQKRVFLSKLIDKYIKQYSFDIFESDPYWVVTRDKVEHQNKRWTLRYHNDISFASRSKKEIEDRIRSQIMVDFSFLTDFMWHWADQSKRRFLVKILTKEFDDEGWALDYKIAHWAGKKFDRPVTFLRMPDQETVKFWESQGFSVMKAKDSMDYRFGVFEKKIIPNEALEFRSSGFSSEMGYFYRQERLLNWFQSDLLELFSEKQMDYLSRRYTQAISVSGYSIELLFDTKE